MKTFYLALVNSLMASVTNTFVWFAVTFWVYLETQSVIATSVMAGVYTLTIASTGFFLGSVVDRYKKKTVMAFSSFCSLVLYACAFAVYILTPPAVFKEPTSVALWVFIILALVGAIAGNLRGIALSTLVTLMVAEEERDKANGLVGTANGVAFLIASILSGLVVGFWGIGWMLMGALTLTFLALIHLWALLIPDYAHKNAPQAAAQPDSLDLRGTIQAINAVPGLFALIFFSTFNNFLGGIFMSLMDAYGLLLVSVQVWGALWGFLSLAFIVGGLLVARRGLGANPLRTLLFANMAMWTICIFFTLQASIVLMVVGMFVWLCLIPAVEAAEQTILQKVVTPERQGRVFGFAQSVEQAASPVTAFLIGPVAQWIFIPFMTTGAGVELFGPWLGVGTDRGLALLFTAAGLIGFLVTLAAIQSNAYRILSAHYAGAPATPELVTSS